MVVLFQDVVSLFNVVGGAEGDAQCWGERGQQTEEPGQSSHQRPSKQKETCILTCLVLLVNKWIKVTLRERERERERATQERERMMNTVYGVWEILLFSLTDFYSHRFVM